MSMFNNPDPSRPPDEIRPSSAQGDADPYEAPRSAAKVLGELHKILDGSDDLSSLRQAVWDSGAQDVPFLIAGVHSLLSLEPKLRTSRLVLAAMNELISELGEYQMHAEKLAELSLRILQCADELGDAGTRSKSSLQYARLCLQQDPPQISAAQEYLESGLELNAAAFGPLVGKRGYDLLEEMCTLAELQQQVVDFEGARRSADNIETVLDTTGSLIDPTIINAARVAADIRASSGDYQQAALILSDILMRADGVKKFADFTHSRFDQEGIKPEHLYCLGVALRDYGDILISLPGHAAEAEVVLRRAASILDEGDEDFNPDGVYVNVMTSLADALSAQGKFEEAMELRRKFGE